MIAIGLIDEINGYTAKVSFGELDTVAVCEIVQPMTGDNKIYQLPNVGDQVVCFLQKGRNILLGCLYNEVDKIPKNANPKAVVFEIGQAHFSINGQTGKLSIKNDATSLQAIFKEFANLLKNLKVVVAGTPGNISPDALPQILILEQKIESLLT